MFTLPELKNEILERYKEDVELEYLEKCIHIWQIEPVNPDEEDNYLFDEKTVHKIYRGIKLKNAGYNEKIIPVILNKTKRDAAKSLPTKITKRNVEKVIQEVMKEREKTKQPRESVKQPLTTKPVSAPAQMDRALPGGEKAKTAIKELAQKAKTHEPPSKPPSAKNQKAITDLSDKIAVKVSKDLLNYFEHNPLLEKLLDVGKLKRDNELLSQQVNELIGENNMLSTKNKHLEERVSGYKKLFGRIYIKL